jgi:hypothetical protein
VKRCEAEIQVGGAAVVPWAIGATGAVPLLAARVASWSRLGAPQRSIQWWRFTWKNRTGVFAEWPAAAAGAGDQAAVPTATRRVRPA